MNVYVICNILKLDGGAFLLTFANVNLVMRRCVFWGNAAMNSGGAIYSSSATSNLLLEACRWEHNTCKLFGGAVYLGDNHAGVVMRASVLMYNSARANSGDLLEVCGVFGFFMYLYMYLLQVGRITSIVSTAALSSKTRTLSAIRRS